MIEQILDEIIKRTNEIGSWRSDDFGHDCDALLRAESKALQEMCDLNERLCETLIECREQRDFLAKTLVENVPNTTIQNNGDTKLVEILGSKK